MLVMTTPLTAELKRLHKLCFCCDFDSFRHHKLPKNSTKRKRFHPSHITSSHWALFLLSSIHSCHIHLSKFVLALLTYCSISPVLCGQVLRWGDCHCSPIGTIRGSSGISWQHRGRWENRERDREPAQRLGTKDPWPIYHDASLCSSGSEVNLPLHNFITHIQAQMCAHRRYRSAFYHMCL